MSFNRLLMLSSEPTSFNLQTTENDSDLIGSIESGPNQILSLSKVFAGSEPILHFCAVNQGFFIVHADMMITELRCENDVWKIVKHAEFKKKQFQIKFIEGGDCNVWIVTNCNRLFNYGSDGIFKQKGKLLENSKVGAFTESSSAFLENISSEEPNEKREITHFSCGRYHSCLVVNRRWAFGCGYSSFYQTGLKNSSDVEEFTQSLFHEDGIDKREMKHTIKELHCGRYFTMILSDHGEVWVTGSNENNQSFSTQTNDCYHKLDLFQNVLKAQSAKLGYHSIAITSGFQIEEPGPFSVVSNGWNDNGQLGTTKDESKRYNFVNLPFPLSQHSPDVENLEVFPIFTRTFFRYRSNIYETKKKGIVQLEIPFDITFMDDVKIVGGSNFSLLLVAEKHSKMVKHFFKQLQNSYKNHSISDIKIIVTNTAY